MFKLYKKAYFAQIISPNLNKAFPFSLKVYISLINFSNVSVFYDFRIFIDYSKF